MSALVRGNEKLKPRPRAVVLFGSLARATRDFRDIDLLCVVAKESDRSLLHDSIAGAYRQVQREFKVPVSAVVATDAELDSPKLGSVIGEARRDGLLLFGNAPHQLRGVRVWESDDRRAK